MRNSYFFFILETLIISSLFPLAMRKIVYLGHALTDFSSKTGFRDVTRFHWDLLLKKISFNIKFLIKIGIEVDKW